MADLISYMIPSLIQGVSQQPDAQRDPSQGEIQINGMSSITEGLRKRDNSITLAKVSDTPFGDVFIHSILRDRDEKYLAVISKTSVKVFDLAGNEKTVSAPGGYGYLSTVTDARDQVRAATIADYTFILNTKKVTAMDPTLAPPAARPAAYECLIWVKAANYGQSYVVNVNNVEVQVQTPVAPVVSNAGVVTEYRISTKAIADQIATGLAGATGVTIEKSGSVLWLRSASPITVKATDARANADITAILNTVQVFTELPTIAPKGYQVEIAGDPGNNFDGYYVEFVPRSGDFGEGYWDEVVSPGTEYKIDANTMPHVLVRKPNGTFLFAPANGTTVESISLPKWGDRTAGDYETAPDPGFIGWQVNDVFVYKNRLGMLADENITLSRPREFFDFFPSTVTTTLDTDPIDLTASNNRVSVLKYAVPYQDELILFSQMYQFRFNSSEAILTAKSANITVLTDFEMSDYARPQAAGGSLLFVQDNGNWSQFREFSVRTLGTSVAADAQDLTGYVSSFVPNRIFKMTVNDTGNTAFMISGKSGYENRIYVYKYFFRNSGGGTERAQASWSYWDFGIAAKVLQIVCVKEQLYCLMQRGEKVFLEVISAADRLSEATGTLYPMLLDRRVTTALPSQLVTEAPSVNPAMQVAKGTYNAITKKTTWTMPYTMTGKTQAWSSFTEGGAGGVLLAEASTGTTLSGRGDWSQADVVFGEPYQFRYRFSRFKYMKEIGGGKASSNAMRTQVRHARLRYHETGFFETLVTPEHRDESRYVFDGTILASRNSSLGVVENPTGSETKRYYEGVFNIPVMSKGENCIVELRNSTIHPCKFSTCEWVAMVSGKAGSIQ